MDITLNLNGTEHALSVGVSTILLAALCERLDLTDTEKAASRRSTIQRSP